MTSKEFMKAYIDGVCICARWDCRISAIKNRYIRGCASVLGCMILCLKALWDLLDTIVGLFVLIWLVLLWPLWAPFSWLWFAWRRRDVVEQCRKLMKGTPQ